MRHRAWPSQWITTSKLGTIIIGRDSGYSSKFAAQSKPKAVPTKGKLASPLRPLDTHFFGNLPNNRQA